MDSVQASGKLIRMTKRRPPHTAPDKRVLREQLAALVPESSLEELRRQNQDLIAALDDVTRQKEQLLLLNAELQETNRGVMALYSELSDELEQTNRGVVALYRELDEKSEELRLASESKNRFWANVSHELRTPLNSILGLTRLLADPDGGLGPEQLYQVDLIRNSTGTLLTLVNDLLDVAKAESGQLVIEPAEVSLPALLAALRGLVRPMAEDKPVTVVVSADGAPATILTDEMALTAILRNLLSNAIKYTDSGEVRLSVGTFPDRVEIQVSDTGTGIPAGQLERVFEEFYQVPGAKRGGTGLGLPYARKLAGLLDGELSLTSEVGRGTTAVLSLPHGTPSVGTVVIADDDAAFRRVLTAMLTGIADRLIETADGAEALAAVTAARRRPDPCRPADAGRGREDAARPAARRAPRDRHHRPRRADAAAGRRPAAQGRAHQGTARVHDQARHQGHAMSEAPGMLLLVDDDEAKRYVLGTWLRRAGHTVMEVGTGREALAVAATADLVLLDVNLPDMSGFDVCRQIKTDPRTAAIPVIQVSATAVEVADRAHGLTQGADAYLVEPTEPEELLATVTAALRYYRARTRAERTAAMLAALASTTLDINAAETFDGLAAVAAADAARIFSVEAVLMLEMPDGQLRRMSGRPGGPAPVRRGGLPGLLDGVAERVLGPGAGSAVVTMGRDDWLRLVPDSTLRVDVCVAAARVKRGKPPTVITVDGAGLSGGEDMQILGQLAQSVALSVEALRSSAEDHLVAMTLQRSFLPAALPAIPDLTMAFRYLPASDQAEVGGDFYEALPWRDGVLIAIGDVQGHSLHAATVMGELRHALRAFATEAHSPVEITSLVNEVLRRYHPGMMATLCLVLVEPATGELSIVNCGHMPLLLVSGAGAAYAGEGGLVLGLTRHEPHTETAVLPVGGTALLFTDGLVEDRKIFLDTNLEILRAAAHGGRGRRRRGFRQPRDVGLRPARGRRRDDRAAQNRLGGAHRFLQARVDRHEAADAGQLEHPAHRAVLGHRQPQLDVARGGPLVSPHDRVHS